MRKRFLQRLKGFLHGNQGSAIVEFALTFPLMLMFVYGAYELITIGLIKQRVELTAQTIAQALSDRRTTVGACGCDVRNIIKNIPAYALSRYNGAIFIHVSALSRPGNGVMRTAWQAELKGTAPHTSVEVVQGTGNPLVVASSTIELNPNESLYVVEVAYTYRPILKLFDTTKASEQKRPSGDTSQSTANAPFNGRIFARAVSIPQSGELARWC